MRLALLASALLSASAAAQTPATAPGDYEAARGAPFGDSAPYIWDISVTGLDGEPGEDKSLTASLGPDWARWNDQDGAGTLIDLSAARFITIESGEGDAPAQVTNSSLYAEARRRIDIYAGLSQGGSRDQISFGDAGTFHRIWLEAAMGVAARAGALEIGQAPGVLSASDDGEMIAEAWFAQGDDSPCQSDPTERLEPMLALLRHAAPLHPDLISAFRQLGVAPCALEFTVFSPDSPQGRTETWVLQTAEDGPPPLPSDGVAVLPRAGLVGEAALAAIDIANSDGADVLDPAAFYEMLLALRSEDDLAGAFLLSVQETHNFGTCPEQVIGSARLVCGELNALTQAGLGDSDFERALEGVTAVREAQHAVAVNQLSRFLDRNDRAGAAARILVANELIAWGEEGLASRPDLDPAALLSEALIIDPQAPDAYWHLGRRYLEAGAPHAAWVFFDLGRSIPGREATPLLEQAGQMEQRIAALAPDLAPAPRGESGEPRP
jgi:tetratricopeptide (TPR) repeat protein